ncbi:MAG: glycosyltransferase family 4 protein [Pseudomonadota bacterium]
MKFLFCCEYYHPSRGGVQEVMRQIAERFVQSGHDVTVATTRMAERESLNINGVHIEEFNIHGNYVSGMTGEIDRYRSFIETFPADAILIKAAQQWTFDAIWPSLDKIKARKVFIPCGFSGLYLPQFASYFEKLPAIMRKFDHLIFYAEHYRDIDFARANGMTNFSVLSNGASDIEFSSPLDKNFRTELGIPEKDFLFLTVGTPVNAKGHLEVLQAFAKMNLRGRKASLVLNGQWPVYARPEIQLTPAETAPLQVSQTIIMPPVIRMPKRPSLMQRAMVSMKRDGFAGFLRILLAWLKYRVKDMQSVPARVFRKTHYRMRMKLANILAARTKIQIAPPPPPPPVTIEDWCDAVEAQDNKKVFRTNLPRPQVVQAFLHADLFVFASHVEYSPIVLFEAAAAATPFLTVPAGNAEEIIAKTRGGILCPADKDRFGYVRVDINTLAHHMETLMQDDELCTKLGEAGRKAFQEKYNWAQIAKDYERVLTGTSENLAAAS